MSLDTLDRQSVVIPEAGELSADEVRRRWDEIIAADTLDEAAQEQLSFAKIAELFADKHAENVELLRTQQEALLEAMLKNPAEAFHGEFLQLQLLYENRTLDKTHYDGSIVEEFCTQNHEKGTIDHLFRYTKSAKGSESYEVRKVMDTFGEPTPIIFRWSEGRLTTHAQIKERSRTVDIEVSDERRQRLLEQLFVETIHASSLQIERSPEELFENDNRAKSYLKMMRDKELPEL